MYQKITNPQILENQQKSLQLNRLIYFIQNKKSPSIHKPKNITPNKEILISDRVMINIKRSERIQNESIAVNTKNIFIGRNKTQTCSPKTVLNIDQDNCNLFIAKQEIFKLYQRQKIFLNPPSPMKQEKSRSNIFPSLVLPRVKRPVNFQKYQEQTNLQHNNKIRNSKQRYQLQIQGIQPQQLCKNKQGKTQKTNQNLQIQRQKYNKSLQKLIEKAFKDQRKQKPLIQSQLQSIKRKYNKHTRQEQKSEGDAQDNSRSIYASKGKLISNSYMKIKKDCRSKSQREANNRPNTLRCLQITNQNKNNTNLFDIEQKKRIIHTNRQIHENLSLVKLKTQIASNAPAQQDLKSKKQNKTLRLISQFQNGIIKNEKKKQMNFLQEKKIIKRVDSSDPSYLSKVLVQAPAGQKNQNANKQRNKKPRQSVLKTKQLTFKPKQTNHNWQIVGYDWKKSTQDFQQNLQLQSYVQNVVRKSSPLKSGGEGIEQVQFLIS